MFLRGPFQKFEPQFNRFFKLTTKERFLEKKYLVCFKDKEIIGSKVWNFFLNCKKS